MSKLKKKIRRNAAALDIAEERWAKFQACKHRNMQQFTECCMDCFENIYITKDEMIRQEKAELKSQEEDAAYEDHFNGW